MVRVVWFFNFRTLSCVWNGWCYVLQVWYSYTG